MEEEWEGDDGKKMSYIKSLAHYTGVLSNHFMRKILCPQSKTVCTSRALLYSHPLRLLTNPWQANSNVRESNLIIKVRDGQDVHAKRAYHNIKRDQCLTQTKQSATSARAWSSSKARTTSSRLIFSSQPSLSIFLNLHMYKDKNKW